jgi:hypothetical protein
MSFSHFTRRITGGFVVALLMGLGAHLAAQTQSPLFVILDKDAIDYGPSPHLLPADAVDPLIAGVGVRDELPYFSGHVGQQAILTSGHSGNDGWFALKTVPASWATQVGAADGLENYLLAGPGLGSPDDNDDRQSLLNNIPNVTPVRAAGLNLLVGRKVCAVVYRDDVVVTAGSPRTASLNGPNLGRIAFKVLALLPTDNASFPNVQVEVLDRREACGESTVLFASAPNENP